MADFVDPTVEIITERNPIKKIELCGRVCYKSENKITSDSARKFVENIISRGHTSVLEHSWVRVLKKKIIELDKENTRYITKPYGFIDRVPDFFSVLPTDHISMNARDYIAIGGSLDELDKYEESDGYTTVRFVCDRGVSHELVRHRTMSFSQESTRYVNYKGDIKFVIPYPFDWTGDVDNKRFRSWALLCEDSEIAYNQMIADGASPQEARSVLPTSVKTELIMTGKNKMWGNVIKLRDDKAAHPQCRYLFDILKTKAPWLWEYIG